MKDLRDDEVRQAVRKTYGDIANAGSAGCGSGPSSCCGQAESPSAQAVSVKMGYSEDDVFDFVDFVRSINQETQTSPPLV